MSTTEQLKYVKTMAEALQILKMSEYLPFFEKANIFQASALAFLREADLKCIGIDNSGRQKLLRAIRSLPKNTPVTVGERIRQGSRSAVKVEPKCKRIDEEEFYLQKAEDELLRCRVELNLKRNELARIQKQAKLTREIFEMAADAQKDAQKLRKHCSTCDNESIKQMATDLERLFSHTLFLDATSPPSSENVASFSAVQNQNSSQPSFQRYRPEPPLKSFQKCNDRVRYVQHSRKTTSGPWYWKILKPATNQCRQQAIRNAPQRICRPPSPSPLRVQRFSVVMPHHGGNEKYHAAAPLSAPTTPQSEHSSFVDGFFSKFGKNKTSTPYKEPFKQHLDRNGSTRHHSFVYQSRKKVKKVFMRTPTH